MRQDKTRQTRQDKTLRLLVTNVPIVSWRIRIRIRIRVRVRVRARIRVRVRVGLVLVAVLSWLVLS
jgi:hypothetical protein